MNKSHNQVDALHELAPLPEGWQMLGEIPLNVALHAKILAGECPPKASTRESAQRVLAEIRNGTYAAPLSQQAQVFLRAWHARNEALGEVEKTGTSI